MILAIKYQNRCWRYCRPPTAFCAAAAVMFAMATTFSVRAKWTSAAVNSSSHKDFIIKHLPDIGHAHRLEAHALATTGTAAMHAALHNLISLADSQDAVAEYWLGRYYIAEGKAGTRQQAWGIRWLKDSQDKGCRRAAEWLYTIYSRNHPAAKLSQKYLQRAAKLGWPPAQYAWGWKLLRGNHVRAGIHWIGQAACAHYLPAVKTLYHIAIDPNSVYRRVARKGLYQAAATEWVKADRYAAFACFKAPRPNYPAALQYAMLGANNGDMGSQELAGIIYLNGDGVKQDWPLAFHLFTDASRLPGANALAGYMLLYGLGTAANPTLGIRRLKVSYHKGSGRAAFFLANYFLKNRNIQTAENWFGRAVQAGKTPYAQMAMFSLGAIKLASAKTHAGQINDIKLIRQAALAGIGGAELKMGDLYAVGTGVARNRAKAITWLNRAAKQGGVVAAKAEELLAALHAGVPKTGH